MGSQVAILGAVEDIAELLAVASRQRAQAVPEFVPADETPELHRPDELFRSRPAEKLYLLPGDIAAVEIFTIHGSSCPGVERVNDRTSPVVEVMPTRVIGQAMRSGRLYLGTSPSDSLFHHAKRLYDCLKKATDSWVRAEPGNVRVGPQAAEQAHLHGLVLESGIGEQLTLVAASEK